MNIDANKIIAWYQDRLRNAEYELSIKTVLDSIGIKSGALGNGRWIKFPDGTMIINIMEASLPYVNSAYAKLNMFSLNRL